MEYTALNHANWETRLLKLLVRPETIDTPMKFEVHVVSLTDMPKYRALSYCWGEHYSGVGIDISGQIVPVGLNLVDALYNCGLANGDFIWADAVCINQNDLHEKNYQVSFMDQIYARAESTTAWLGQPGPGTHDASVFLLSLAAQAAERIERKPPTYANVRLPSFNSPRPFTANNLTNETLEKLLGAKRFAFEQTLREWRLPIKALHGFRDLLSRPYWARIWIIQEVAKSRRVDLRCGESRIPLELLLLVAEIIDDLPEYAKGSINAIQQFRRQELSRQPLAERTNLLESLVRSRHSLATIAHDKIFALIGMTNDGRELLPMPTYTETQYQVFDRFTAALLESKQPNLVLLMKYYAPASDISASRSNTTVDWSELRYLPPWLATISPVSRGSGSWSFDRQASRLHTNGRSVGHISHATCSKRQTSPTPKGTFADEVAVEIMEHVASNLLGRLSSRFRGDPEFSEEDRADALVRIIRDAHIGERTVNCIYSFDRVHDTAAALGQLTIRGNPLWEWARDYIFAKTKARRPSRVETPSEIYSSGYDSSPATTPEVGSSKPPARKRRRLKEWKTPPLEDTAFRVKAAALRVWENVLDGLDGFPHAKLGFAALYENYELALVHPDTEKNDEVFQIDQCPLPVVLRKSYTGIYTLVGEACLGRREDGSWIEANEAMPALELGDVETRQLTISLEPEVVIGF